MSIHMAAYLSKEGFDTKFVTKAKKFANLGKTGIPRDEENCVGRP